MIIPNIWENKKYSKPPTSWDCEIPNKSMRHTFALLFGVLNPSEKYQFVNWDDNSQYFWENNPNVPNHQPGVAWGLSFHHTFPAEQFNDKRYGTVINHLRMIYLLNGEFP